MLNLILIVILSYLVGSIPTSIIVSKLVRGIDIRNYGSGNAGGTNVIRVIGFGWGVFVILVDAFKGYFATVFIARWFYTTELSSIVNFTTVQIIAGCFAVIGHIWTVFAGFRGGKGVSTSAGMLLGIAPVELGIVFVVFLIVVALTRYVSLGSITSALLFPFVVIFTENILKLKHTDYKTLIIFTAIMSALIIYKHRSNIKRLILGTENRINLTRR